MFKSICLALDGSDQAKKAVPVAAELAEAGDAKIVIAHVIEMVAGKGGVVPIHEEEAIRPELEAEAKRLEQRGIDTEIEVVHNVLGGPAHAIAEVADRHDADLIVSGTRGRNMLTSLLLGSVAQRLIQISGRPTLTVPS